jgi:hypothetical protein
MMTAGQHSINRKPNGFDRRIFNIVGSSLRSTEVYQGAIRLSEINSIIRTIFTVFGGLFKAISLIFKFKPDPVSFIDRGSKKAADTDFKRNSFLVFTSERIFVAAIRKNDGYYSIAEEIPRDSYLIYNDGRLSVGNSGFYITSLGKLKLKQLARTNLNA